MAKSELPVREAQNPLIQRLNELRQAEASLIKITQTTKGEAVRRAKEVQSLTSLIGRQQQALNNLASSRTKVILLEEYRTLKLSLKLNHSNLALAHQMEREAKRQLASSEEKLKLVQSTCVEIQKELDSRGKLLPFRRA